MLFQKLINSFKKPNAWNLKELETQLKDISALETIEDRIEKLHELEFSLQEYYCFPWKFWTQLPQDALNIYLKYQDRIFTTDHADPVTKAIVSSAKNSRIYTLSQKPSDPIFKAFEKLEHAPEEYGLHLYLEFLFLCRFEDNQDLLALHAPIILKQPTYFSENKHYSEIRDTIFDMYSLAIIRGEMDTFTEKPQPLVAKLKAISITPEYRDILTRDSFTALTFSANLKAISDNIPEALSLYEQASQHAGFRTSVYDQTHVMKSVATISQQSKQTEKWFNKFHQTNHHYNYQPTDEHAILVSCDRKYYTDYAELFVQIITETKPNALIHFHLVNFGSQQAQTINQMREWEIQYNLRFNWTFEENDFLTNNPKLVSAVCSCSRYIFLPEYLEKYKSVSISDIDGWVLSSLDTLSDFSDHDVLICSWIWRKFQGYWRLPWGNIAGNHFSIKSSTAGKKYASLISLYLKYLFRENAHSGKAIFYGDQSSMFVCLLHLQQTNAINIGFLVQGFGQSPDHAYISRVSSKQHALAKKLEDLKTQHVK